MSSDPAPSSGWQIQNGSDDVQGEAAFSTNDAKKTWPKCAGFWLDSGELAAVRSEYANETDRERETSKYFDDVCRPQLSKEHADFEAKLEKIQKAAKLFSFLTPMPFHKK